MATTTGYSIGANIGVDSPHAMLHDGVSFTLTVADRIGANQFVEIAITPPEWSFVHLLPCPSVEKSGRVRLTEDVADIGGGSPIVPTNRNRASGKLSNVSARVGSLASPLTYTGGTQLPERFIPDASDTTDSTSNFEWVLKPGVTTVIRLTSDIGGNDVTLVANWYEPAHRTL